jgi:hypothetical protein
MFFDITGQINEGAFEREKQVDSPSRSILPPKGATQPIPIYLDQGRKVLSQIFSTHHFHRRSLFRSFHRFEKWLTCKHLQRHQPN